MAKGAKAQRRSDAITDRLGIATVGDLLRHFPRRYLETGSLSSPDDLREGQLITVVGEISQSVARTYRDRRTGRPAYRQEVSLRTEGPSLQMTFFAQQSRVGQWNERRLAPGRRGIFMGKVGRFRDQWQLANPQMVLFGAEGEASDDQGHPRWGLWRGGGRRPAVDEHGGGDRAKRRRLRRQRQRRGD